MYDASLPYTWTGFRHGLSAGIGLAAGALPYGIAFGALATQLGFSPVGATAMSALVHSSTAQFAVLQIWSEPLILLPILFTTFAMNARYLLYGALLRPYLEGLSAWRCYPALFVLSDANWAIMMRQGREGRLDGAFALGSGLAMYGAWLSGTWLGCQFGIRDLGAVLALDFLLPLYFVTILVGLWRGRRDVPPLTAAVAGTLLAFWLLGPAWSVVCGGVAGALVGIANDD